MYRRLLALFAALSLLLGAGVALGSGTPQPHNVLLSRFRTEPIVAIDPADPSLVVAGGNTDYIPRPDGTLPVPYFTSHDGGASFSVGTLPLVSPYTTAADPSVAIAPDGTVFYSYLAESPNYCASGNGPGAVLLAHSIDHGVSFRGPGVVDSNPADDRPALAVEGIPGRTSHLFEAWTRSYADHSEIWLARSADGGATFAPATRLYSSALDNFGAEPVAGPDGRVYVFWLSRRDVAPAAAGSAQVLMTASQDDGAHFGQVRGAGPGFTTLPQLAQPGSFRDLTTFDAASAPSGAIYLAYAAVRDRHRDGSVDADIWLRRSVDQGSTWSAAKRVNDVGRGDRFMPALSILADGTLGVAFYDRRLNPGELDVYAARTSFARRFAVTQNVKVNNGSSRIDVISFFKGTSQGDACFPSGRFFGDYIGAATDGAALGVVWADTQLHQKGETDLWFARVVFPPLPQTAHKSLSRPASHRTGLAGGWAEITGAPGAFFLCLSGLAARSPFGGLSGTQLVVVCMLFLLPALTAVTALVSLRRSAD